MVRITVTLFNLSRVLAVFSIGMIFVTQLSASSLNIGWLVGQWQDCNATCGGGYQWRDVYCAERTNGTDTGGSIENHKVHNRFCFQSKKPENGRPCSQQSCPVWEAADWTQCSVTCGKGVRTRLVDCRQERYRSMDRFACDPKGKPTAKQNCFAGNSCEEAEENRVADYERYRYVASAPFTHWADSARLSPLASSSSLGRSTFGAATSPRYQPGPWSQCSTTCGPGVKTRRVQCAVFQAVTGNVLNLPDYECEGSPKPPEFLPCEERRCPPKSDSGARPPSPYGPGDRRPQSSGVRKQRSTMKCVELESNTSVAWALCNPMQRPIDITRSCNNQSCPPRWDIGTWSVCSHSCGKGLRTRRVRCVRQLKRASGAENTLITDDGECSPLKPVDREICNISDCPPEWKAAQWAQCSTSCGAGQRRRLVLCEQRTGDGTIRRFNPPTQCERVDKPHSLELCNLGACQRNGPPSSPSTSYGNDLQKQLSALTGDKDGIVAPSSSLSKAGAEKAGTHFEQRDNARRVKLRVGGSATLFEGTSVKVKCPVSGFDRSKIRWTKDGRLLTKSTGSRVRVSKFGALRIVKATRADAGLYACIADGTRGNVSLAFKPPRFRWGNVFAKTDNHAKTNELPAGEQPTGRQQLHEQKTTDDDAQTLKALATNSVAVYKPQQNVGPELQTPIEKLKEYLIRNDNMDMYNALVLADNPADVVKVEWVLGDWSACSQSCAGGTGSDGMQFRRVQCRVEVASASTDAKDDACVEAFSLAKPHETRACNVEACPKWDHGAWSECEKSRCHRYSTSMQRRQVFCAAANQTRVDNKLCPKASKPTNKTPCFNSNCVAIWRPSAWGPCTKSCINRDDTEPASDTDSISNGVEMRFIRCVWNGTRKAAGSSCKGETQPKLRRPCRDTPKCPPGGQAYAQQAGPFKGNAAIVSVPGDCVTESRHCPSMVRRRALCHEERYRRRCCLSCHYVNTRR